MVQNKAKPFFRKLINIIRRLLRHAFYYSIQAYKTAHHHAAHRPHIHLLGRFSWYKKWHEWNHHHHIHYAFLAIYLLLVGSAVLVSYQKAMAASDLSDTWNFANASDYNLSEGLEIADGDVRLKAQNYTTDAHTKALFHLDETSGPTASDSSAHNNIATNNGAAFSTAGILNNGLVFNGVNSHIQADDSASLSLAQENTLEAWTKLDEPLSAGSHDNRQGIIDKGSYKLYYDHETGKATYELENSSATQWSQKAGNDIRGSWDLNGKMSITSQVTAGSSLYVGLGNAVGDAEVWRWDGTIWSQIGGDDKNNSWADQTFESVTSLAISGSTLYAGLGLSAGDAEVWSCNTTTNCSTWTKIGGDGINNSWAVNTFESVQSMTVMGGNLYVGLGLSANDAQIYRWNGTTWTRIGGFGIGAPYNAFPTGYEGVYNLVNDGTSVYASFGNTAGDGDVWRLTGTTWTQIGGDGLNSSWGTSTYEYAYTLHHFGGNLYAGLGTTAGEAELWRWNGTSWTQIGGDAVGSSWDASSYEMIYDITNDGTNIYVGLGLTAGDNEVWRYNGTSWTKIGGDGLNSGFTNTHTNVQTLSYSNGTLYAGLSGTTTNAESWSWNGTTWTRIGGGYINHSWGYFNLQNIESMTVYGEYLYAGTGNTVAGNAQVWRYDGSTWEIVGGQGVNNSWAPGTYEDVLTLVAEGGKLYAGLGTTASDAEVWEYNGTTWTKIGGDGLNSSWAAGFEEVYSLANLNGDLYAGIGNSASDAEVWKWNGTSWSKIGGDAINSGWGANYERVSALTVYGGNLYAGLGNSANDAEVWKWNGTAWSKVGGDGVTGSWNASLDQIESMQIYNDKLYAGLGNTTADAEIWEYNGSTWTKIGGDDVNGSWLDGQYEQVRSMTTYNGKFYAALGNTAGDGEVWEYSSGAWEKMGGSGVNSSWASNTIEMVYSFSVYKGKLYAGLGNTANADAAIWSYGDNGYLQSTVAAQNTDWHHIAATYNGTTMKLYIDGTLNNQTNVSLSMPNNTQPLLIGSTFGASEAGWAQGYFKGMIDEVRISDSARTTFTTKPYAAQTQTVTLANAVRKSGVWNWQEFTAQESLNGGSIAYRLSVDGGTSWNYWNGTQWSTSPNTSSANPISVINDHISELPVTFGGITWQAVIQSDGYQRVALNSVGLEGVSDIDPPTSGASSLAAQKASGGTDLTIGSWTNGSSPYFTWTAGNDGESGIKGYCAYLGQEPTADPITTKGILGTSPEATGDNCQFIVSDTHLDTNGLLEEALATSDTPYYFTLKTIDAAGNIAPQTAQFSFRFDNTKPINPTYITVPSGFINTKNVTLSWPTVGTGAPNDANAGIAGLQYRIGSSDWYGDNHTGTGDNGDLLVNDGSYGTLPTPDYGNINEGVNTIYFRTWDLAGNVSTAYATAALKINTAGAPSEPQNLQATPASSTANSFAFNWDVPQTFVGDANTLTYCYVVNAAPSASNCTFTSGGTTSLGAAAYATQPGENTIYVVAKDESGSINYADYATTQFSANTPSPGMPLNVDIVDVSIKTTSNWRLALTWDVPGNTGAGIASYRVYRSSNNETFSFVGSSSSTTYIDAGLSQNKYYYRIAACDSTNNCGANSSVVTETPTGKFTSPAQLVADPSVSNITTRRATVRWSTDRPSDSKIAIGTSSGKYNTSEIAISDQVSAHQVDLANLSAGTTYYLIAKWTDEDGNTGVSQEYTFRTAPAPTLKEISTLKVGLSSAVIEFTSKDASRVDVFYGKSEGFGGLQSINTSTSESTYSVALDGLDDGTKYFYKLVAFDNEGNEYDGSIASFTTPARPRVSNLRFQPVPGQPTSTQKVSWNTNVPSTSLVTYGKVGTGGSDVQDANLVTEHELTLRNLEDDSIYFLVAQSRDPGGNLATSDRQQFKTALDTRPPKISNIVIESSIRGTGAEARGQVIVSWRTDEPATSQVAYAEGSNVGVFNNKTSEDGQLGTEHIVIVSDLPTSKVYSIQPLSKDRAGNEGKGETQSAIISRASDSVLTVILDSLQKVFGF